MRRSTSLAIAFGSLAVPLVALAAYASPSALFAALNDTGAARTISTEAHVHLDGDDIALWVKGETEGKTLATAKAKANVTFDHLSDGVLDRVRMRVMILDGKLYLRMISGKGLTAEDLRNWQSYSLTEPSQHEDAKAMILQMLRDEGINMTEEQLTDLIDRVINAVFSMDSAEASGLTSYSLRLQPAFLTNLATIWNETVAGLKTLTAQQRSDWTFTKDDIASFSEMQKMVLEHVNFHVRVGVTPSGVVLTQKAYVAGEYEGDSFVFVTESATKDGHVVVVAPQGNVIDNDDILDQIEEFSVPTIGDCTVQQLRAGTCQTERTPTRLPR